MGFNPRTPCGVRHRFPGSVIIRYGFQSTHSLRSATASKVIPQRLKMFQSTHSLRSATNLRMYREMLNPVSIHALLAECDGRTAARTLSYFGFNPRTPCGVRPASSGAGGRLLLSFNPRTPCGVRPGIGLYLWRIVRFQSTHSLRSATKCAYANRPSTTFQSTHSLRSATGGIRNRFHSRRVSIHALLAECDS